MMDSTAFSKRDLMSQEAAYLFAERGRSQQDIAPRLGVTQSFVSKLLKHAESRGWLVRTAQFVADKLPPERVAEIRRHDEPRNLVQLLAGVAPDNGVHVRDLRVVGSASKGETPQALRRRLNQFGLEAGSALGDWLPRSDMFAVTWGTTVSHVVDGIQPIPSTKGGRRAVRFVPVCGEPLEQASEPDTSSHLAQRLHRRCQTTASAPPSLTGVPALISRRFHGPDGSAIRRFVQDAGSYKEVFGPWRTRPLIDGVDSLLTSVGSAAKPMGFIHQELLSAASAGRRKLTAAVLTRLVAGDIGGVLIPRRSLSARERREVEALNAMWTGIRREHLERIAREADKKGRPGIIVVAMGGVGRAETIAELLRCGLINVLIIDPELAAGLTRILVA